MPTDSGRSAEYFIQRGKLHRDLGRPQEALAEYARALEVDPTCHMAHCQQGIVQEVMGHYAAAGECYARALDLDPQNGMYWMGRGKCLRMDGDEAGADAAFDEAERWLERDTAYNRACLASLRGRADQALALLAAFCAEHPFAAEWARQDPDLAGLRDHPGFEAALRPA
nr:tetratricopeptide repeat protein [Lysobacter sp. CAU 1642]